MTHRRNLLTVALGLAAIAGATGPAAAQAAAGGHMSLADCIALCLKCHAACQDAVGKTLSGAGRAEPALVMTLLDCAEICQATANSMARGSPVHTAFCAACAQVCDACAEACGKAEAAAALQACADLCRECAMSCRHMAGSMR
ncbi:MAG: four-helix bundle copper-binding protein [Phenylobacterium sp.]|uniref:four-helix bundle copper-binding protein n=1 Tax=Phenylobacterium sp. TaxID=1871053 RepID=UPI00122BB557|nr:four-helix bundle copper-binding protein [Phenylobacterium sp.]TAJ71743.1 MAG: four-helix bundle copper-binding protein [Phenylobacterium sp.]